MKKIISQVLDFPMMVNQKLPKNNFNTMMEESEDSIKGWTGTFYTVAALVLLVTSIVTVLSPIWEGGMGDDGIAIVSNIIAMLIAVYAAFPIAQVVRSAGDSLSASKSSIVDFIFKDLVLTNIKVVGHVTALVALFGAICMTISWFTTLNISGLSDVEMAGFMGYAMSLPMDALSAFTNMLGLGYIGEIVAGDWASFSVASSSGEAWTMSGLMSVGWGYVQVVVVLAQLYVGLAVYKFLYGLVSTLTAWIQNPSLPIGLKK
jgi:hypothetical protein